ncbi:hypothetical protein EI989_08295 [Streptococcus suis]|nr:hypothetical protein EI985_08350 [Streptococcus suis]RRR40012.1 hypothetical protein EI989_08295 [Streptococcus suis]RRR61494.1 hypothetical protein EI991_08715 [Streptococcus suis]
MFKSDLLIIWYHATKLEQDSLIEHAYNSLKKMKSVSEMLTLFVVNV